MKRVWNILFLAIYELVFIIIYLFNNHIITLMLLFSALFFPVFSGLLLRLQRNRISVDIIFDQSVVERNSSVDIRILIHNRSFFPCSKLNLTMTVMNHFKKNDYEHHYCYFVRAKGDTEYRIPVRMAFCGCYEIWLGNGNITDFLGIYCKKLDCTAKKDLLVMPKLLRLGEDANAIIGNTDEDEIYEIDSNGTDYSEIKNIREYQPGDKLQAVHWKLSAKEQELMVKEFSSLTGDMYQVLIENDYQDLRQMDLFFDVLYSFTSLLSKDGIYYSLCYFSNNKADSLERMEIKNTSDIIDVMIRLFYENSDTNQKHNFENYMRNSGNSNFIMITTKPHSGSKYQLIYNFKNQIRIYQVTKE